MYAVISPAKRLNEPPAAAKVPHSTPSLLDDTLELMETARTLSREDLKALMSISDKLADLNWERFRTFGLPFTPNNSRQAVLCFNGDTYVGLNASELSTADLNYAQSHLGILSGLYGLLRPLDLIQPYRLEMGTSLKNPRGKDLYAFWGSRIAETLNEITGAHEEQSLINLASNEYFKSVHKKTLDATIITPVFQEVKEGRARVISFMAKKARGMMARYIIEERIDRSEGLKDFTVGNYAFQPNESTDTKWVFKRPQPPPAK